MDNKLIFLDIDGTLTEPGANTPPESALNAIRKTQILGNQVFLCTGRNYAMMNPLLRFGFDGYIASAGGYVVVNDQVIYSNPMNEEQRNRVFHVLQENNIFRTVECKNSSYTDEGLKDFLKEQAASSGNSELIRWREQIEKSLNILPMSDYDGSPVYKVVMMGTSMEGMQKAADELKEDFQTVILGVEKSGLINGELLNLEFDKGRAVKRIAEYLGVDMANTFGYGDSMNDKEMIISVGHSVVMDNGDPKLKALANEIAPAVTDDGLYKSFEKNGLI